MNMIKYFNKLNILFLLQLIVLNSYASENLLEKALDAYANENYAQACELYEALIDQNGESAAVYYNLGNAYFKTNKIASAILNYERALLIDPSDSDTRFNLQIAKQRTVDKIEPISGFFIAEWMKSVRNSLSIDTWAFIGIISFIILIICLVMFFFGRLIKIKKIGFYLGIIALISIVSANIFAYKQQYDLLHRNTAIIFAPTTTIKSSPDKSGTDLFVAHEGTKVHIKNKLGEWSEIELEDGNKGWILSNKIELI